MYVAEPIEAVIGKPAIEMVDCGTMSYVIF